MTIHPDDVKNGYWYVKKGDDFSIVRVVGNSAWECGHSISNPKATFAFIAPVPAPESITYIHLLDTPDDMVKLRQELNLSPQASASEVFRAALAFAKQAQAEYRDQNP